MSLPVVHHEAYEVDIGPHVFPTAKYRLVRERLLEEGTIAPSDLRRPEPASDEDVARVHTGSWMGKLRSGELTMEERLRLEVPWSEGLRDASWLCAGGTTLAGRLALAGEGGGVCAHLGGGFHHAFPDHGEGFCAVNDVAVAIRSLRADGSLSRAAVVDLDVHHGNGTAAIFADDPDVFTFSMHQERNYPLEKPPSDLDVGLPDDTGDEEYLALLERHLPRILDDQAPDLVFYLAGADPYREDQLGGLSLSIEGLRRRDEAVLDRLGERAIPCVALLAGGYAWKREDTVEIHCGTVRAAAARAGE